MNPTLNSVTASVDEEEKVISLMFVGYSFKKSYVLFLFSSWIAPPLLPSRDPIKGTPAAAEATEARVCNTPDPPVFPGSPLYVINFN